MQNSGTKRNTSRHLFACKDKCRRGGRKGENMNEREMMKLAESLEEFSESDFTVEELERMKGKENFKEKYFEFYDDVKDRTRKKQDW